ncbi:MAG: hypothetical protein CVV27_01605 [Candidatus Melainabacteria bacterium HGW-Melainabacteria-1]|nr:MAG: hypothetical protein CVV27_01605 [Candidatus Melainabacteria bacterium HGW-Melainabacteria-1]
MSDKLQELRRFLKQFLDLHLQHNGFTILQRYYERHFTPVGKALLLLLMISLSLGMVGTEVLIYVFLCGLAALWTGTVFVGWLSRPRKLSASVIWPAWLQVGEVAQLQLLIHNPGRSPQFHLHSEVVLSGPGQRRLLLRQAEPFFCLDSSEQQSVELSWTPPTRGRWRLKEVQLISMFPLGLALWRQRVHLDTQIWVLPALLSPGDQPWQQHQPQLMQSANQATLLRGASLEFQGIRPWLPGDNPRYIHWPSLARTGQLAVREYQESPGHQICLLLPTGADAAAGFESAVSLMAGLLHSLAALPHHQLLLTQFGQRISLATGGRLSEEDRLLELAQVQADENFPLNGLWDAVQLLPVAPTLLICVSTYWNADLDGLLRQCQLHRWPIEIYAVGNAPGFPVSARRIADEP